MVRKLRIKPEDKTRELTTPCNTVADLLISVKMFFEEVFYLFLIIREFLWADFTEVLTYYIAKNFRFIDETTNIFQRPNLYNGPQSNDEAKYTSFS